MSVRCPLADGNVAGDSSLERSKISFAFTWLVGRGFAVSPNSLWHLQRPEE